MKTQSHARRLTLGSLLLVGVAGAGAQTVFQVTGLSRAGAATIETAERSRSLATGDEVAAGTLQVDAGAQLMMLAEAGVVMVILGPATLELRAEALVGGTRIEVQHGKALCVATSSATQGPPVVFVASVPGGITVEFRVSPGRTYAACDAALAAVGFAGEPGTSLGVSVGGKPRAVASGQYVSVAAGGETELQPVESWLVAEGFEVPWGRNLGVESARAARKLVQDNLFNNIIEWDRYAGAGYVRARVQEWRFNPEIRQTVESVSAPARLTGRGAQPRTQPFAGANSVPLFSPAAAAVQNLRNVGAGVTTAEFLNRNAATILGRTGSQGLGFRGLQQLAIPGTTSAGTRTVGPAGLGAP